MEGNLCSTPNRREPLRLLSDMDKHSLVSKYTGDMFFRYLNLLKSANFGLSIRKSAIFNYLKIKLGALSDAIGLKTTCPSMIFMFTLLRCNLKCSFCVVLNDYDTSEDIKKYDLTPDEFTRILSLDLVKKALIICFTGGEPLLNEHLPELMRTAKKHKYLVGMVTNGLLLNERLDEIKNIGIADIQVSVYENTKKKLEEVLPKVRQYFPLNMTYVLPRSQLVEGAGNGFKDVIDIIRMCVGCGCSSLKYNICHPVGIAKDISEAIFEGDELYNEFVETCKTTFPMVNFAGYGIKKRVIPSRKFTVHLPFPISKDTTLRNCRVPWTVFNIRNNGEFDLCCGIKRFGNIFDDPNLINNEKCRKVRKSLLNPGSLTLEKECVNCMLRYGAYISNL